MGSNWSHGPTSQCTTKRDPVGRRRYVGRDTQQGLGLEVCDRCIGSTDNIGSVRD